MANITFTIPSVLNQSGGEKKTEISADSLIDAFAKTPDNIPVDLNAYMYRFETILDKLWYICGDKDKADFYREASRKRVLSMEKYLWDPTINQWVALMV